MKFSKRPVSSSLPGPEVSAFIDGVRDYAIFVLDPEGHVASWNSGAERIKGYRADEIIGHSLARFYPPEDVAAGKPQRLLAQAAAEGRVEDEGWRVRKDGRRFWADVVISAIRDDSGRLTGFTKVTRDLTDRHAADVRLRQAEERLRLLVESVKEYAIYMLATDGTILSWNSGAERINGYRADEVVGRHFSMFYSADDLADGKPQRELEIAVAEGRYEDEGWRLRKGGTRFWANAVLTAVYDERGELRGFSKVTRDLTDRRRAEDLLRQNEHRTRLLLENIRDYAIFMLDPAGLVATWNAAAERIKGYRAAEVLGRPSSIFYPPADAAAGKPARLLEIARREGRVEDEGWRVRKNGERFWADVVITRVVDESGRLVGYAKVTRDLTERRGVEERLRRSEERLRLMIDSIKDYAIVTLDLEGRVTSWNGGAERLEGYQSSEILGQPYARFFVPEEIEAGAPERHLALAREQGRYETEGWRLRKDGTRFWADVVVSAIRDGDQLVGFAKIIRDMTERRRVRDELAARAEQQAAMAELGLYALQSRDLQAVMSRATEVVKAALDVEMVSLLELAPDRKTLLLRAGEGWRPGLVSAEPPVTVTAGPDAEAGFTLASPWPVVVEDQGRETRFQETPFLREHGVAASLSVVVRSAQPGSQPYGVLGAHARAARTFRSDEVHFLQAAANLVATAIARSRTEEQLRQAQREADQERDRKLRAEAALRERDDFISVAAHELRTPLTALQLKLQSVDHSLKRPPAGDADLTRMTSRVEGALRQTERLGQLVERLLDVSRVVGGRLDLDRQPCDLVAVVADVVTELTEHAQASGSPLVMTSSGPVPGRWDRDRILQVVRNVVANAVKYGAGHPVTITVERAGALARLTVADQGIGIAAEDLPRLFGRFERAAPVRHFGGLGLGLYISRHIVEGHGGAISVESQPGRGATFRVELPLDGPSLT
jgi:PAS domain S-box-containing protein